MTLRLALQRGSSLFTLLAIVAALSFTLVPASVYAAEEEESAVNILDADDLLPTAFTNETGLGDADLQVTIGALIKTVIRFLGIIAVVVVLYGGFKWMTASGNDEKVAEAKRILIAGLIGLAIVLTALAITNFVIGQILGATQDSLPSDL